MSLLHTDNPVALKHLIEETVFVTQESQVHSSEIEEPIDPALENTGPENTVVLEKPKKEIKAEETQKPAETPEVSEPVKSNELFTYQGQKDSKVLFIIYNKEHPYFSPDAFVAFEKTLSALQIAIDSVTLLNLAHPENPVEFKKIMEFFAPKKITLFGVDPEELFNIKIAPNAYMKGRVATVFNTYSFEEMFDNMEKKKLFWGEFKTFMLS